MRKMFAVLLFGALFAGPSLAQDTVEAIPEIDITPKENALVITGAVTGVTEREVTATLTITKSDKNGSANTKQSTQVMLVPGKTEVIASTSLSFLPDANVMVLLEIMDGDTLIASTRTSLGPVH